jgi:dipeptidyl-peptidase 4
MKFLVAHAFFLSFLVTSLQATDIRAGLKRASDTGQAARGLLSRSEVRSFWSADGSHLAYRIETGRNQWEFVRLHLDSGKKSPAFDHPQLAQSLGQAAGRKVDAKRLPIEQLEIAADESARFRAFGKAWRYSAADGISPDEREPQSTRLLAPEEAARGTRRNGEPSELTIENATPGEVEIFWVDGAAKRKSYGKIPAGGSSTQQTYAGHIWLVSSSNGEPLAGIETPDSPSVARVTERVRPTPRPAANLSPDGKWRARIDKHNLSIEALDGGEPIRLTVDGSANDGYVPPLRWSPDSKKLVAFRLKKTPQRKIHIVESSPSDQLQPKLRTLDYTKPGDAISQPFPQLFDLENRRQIPVNNALFANPWRISELEWAADSSEFTFIYNQRGHQLMRMVGVRGDSGSARTVFEDTSTTFIDYSQKFFLHRLSGSREVLWTSERDGYNHLYRIDQISGDVRSRITQGNWNVREIVNVDEAKRQLLIRMVGASDQDPYHVHFARVNFDGSGFTRLTSGDGTHRVEFSPDRKWLVATWSRVDQPPVTELRRTEDGELIAELNRVDDSALLRTGWSRPERFTAKGRDGTTDIHGIIVRPTHFDPTKSYPVIEDIYAGPHDHFVPKSYSPWTGMNAMAELGFIVVKIDGMGTNWRGKKFHDVAWKNLADSGFPDRIAWIKAAAATRPWMDLSRVGIYGGSAGGQSTLAGLLHHGDFYHVGVADCGCHDNRMDKIWWNEAWMGWPVDESYARNSNVTHAAKLRGKLLLIVGELDSNVDPASTAQVVHALQQADKDFDYLPIMNAGHGAAETPYGKRRRAEFFVRHLRP